MLKWQPIDRQKLSAPVVMTMCKIVMAFIMMTASLPCRTRIGTKATSTDSLSKKFQVQGCACTVSPLIKLEIERGLRLLKMATRIKSLNCASERR